MNKVFFCIGLLLFLSDYCLGQKVVINGYVKDESSKEVLINATIANLGDKSGTTTNQYGYFTISISKSDTIVHYGI